MAFSWKRAIAKTLAPAALAVCALLPPVAQAAKNSDPCKTNAKSSACKAQQAKKAPAPKAGSGKSAAAKQAAPAAKKAPPKSSAGKKAASPKGGKQVAAKGTPPKKAGATGKTGKGGKADKAARGRRVAAAAAASAAMPPPAVSARAEAAALRSSTAYVQDLETSTVIFAKNENVVRPIASISKLMTAVVVVDANLPMDEMLEITDDDVDGLKHTTSRLRVGTWLSGGYMLHVALFSS